MPIAAVPFGLTMSKGVVQLILHTSKAPIAELTVRAGTEGRKRIQDLGIVREGYEWHEEQKPRNRLRKPGQIQAATAKSFFLCGPTMSVLPAAAARRSRC